MAASLLVVDFSTFTSGEQAQRRELGDVGTSYMGTYIQRSGPADKYADDYVHDATAAHTGGLRCYRRSNRPARVRR